jgi:hypothetical protein
MLIATRSESHTTTQTDSLGSLFHSLALVSLLFHFCLFGQLPPPPPLPPSHLSSPLVWMPIGDDKQTAAANGDKASEDASAAGGENNDDGQKAKGQRKPRPDRKRSGAKGEDAPQGDAAVGEGNGAADADVTAPATTASAE